MTSNSYFDGETQNGFLPGMSGSVEHATISQQALHNARQNHRSICFAWVDLRNAFAKIGSVLHMLVQHCLQRDHFPPHIRRLVFDYNELLHGKGSVGKEMSPTLSFALGVFKAVSFHQSYSTSAFSHFWTLCTTGPPPMDGATASSPILQSSPTHDYADDLEICSWSVTCCQAQLDLTNNYLLWSRPLQAHPDKCFTAALGFDKAGHFAPINPNLSIDKTSINNLGDADFKYLGKYLNMHSSKVNCCKLTMETLESLLETIDTTPLMASAKVWSYHHFVITKAGWSL